MNKKGMTLVELIMAIAVLGIIMVFVATGMQPVIQSYGVQRKLNESKDIANNTLAIIKNEIRNAKGSVSTSDADGCSTKISSTGKVVSFYNTESQLPASYFGDSNTINLYFTIDGGSVRVSLTVNGYNTTGTFAPYKGNGVAKDGSGSVLCIEKEAPQEDASN